MVASQVLQIFGQSDYDSVMHLIEKVNGELCVCSRLYVVESLSPWGVVFKFRGQYDL